MAGAQAPRAVLVVSAHWETDAPAVNVVRGTNDTIHDLQGLPSEMYKVTLIPHTSACATNTS